MPGHERARGPATASKTCCAIAGVKPLDEAVAHCGESASFGEDDGAAAEARARQPGPERAGIHRGLDQPVERGTAHLQAIAQTLVRVEQQLAEGRRVIALHGVHRVASTRCASVVTCR